MIQQTTMWVLASSWWAAAADFHTKAVSLDGSTEKMANTTLQSIWIANAWTVWAWVNVSSLATAWHLVNIHDSDSTNANQIQMTTLSASWDIQFRVYDSAASQMKRYFSSSTISVWTIAFVLFTWDWTNMKLYFDWVEDTTPTKNTDNSGTMTDSNRPVWVWGRAQDAANPFPWTISAVYVWNVALDQANITELTDSGNWYKRDYRNAVWNYDQQANLKHQWALWKDDTDASAIWTDYVSSWWINIWTNASNISSADVVTFT